MVDVCWPGPSHFTTQQLPNESARHPRQHLQPTLRKTNSNQNSCLSESVRHGFWLEFVGRGQTTLPRKLLQNSAHAQNCLKRPCGPGAWQHGGRSNRPNNGLKPLSCPIYRRSVTAALPSREPRACLLKFLKGLRLVLQAEGPHNMLGRSD